MKQLIIISKKWHHPKISMIVTDEALSFAIDLDDFREAVKKELGVTNGAGDRVDKAFDDVVSGIKGESRKIIS